MRALGEDLSEVTYTDKMLMTVTSTADGPRGRWGYREKIAAAEARCEFCRMRFAAGTQVMDAFNIPPELRQAWDAIKENRRDLARPAWQHADSHQT